MSGGAAKTPLERVFQRRWSPQTARRMPAIERHAIRLHQLGPRITLELLLEIAFRHGIFPDIAERLERYASISPEAVALAGADRMISRRPVLIP